MSTTDLRLKTATTVDELRMLDDYHHFFRVSLLATHIRLMRKPPTRLNFQLFSPFYSAESSAQRGINDYDLDVDAVRRARRQVLLCKVHETSGGIEQNVFAFD